MIRICIKLRPGTGFTLTHGRRRSALTLANQKKMGGHFAAPFQPVRLYDYTVPFGVYINNITTTTMIVVPYRISTIDRLFLENAIGISILLTNAMLTTIPAHRPTWVY
jgi:hypothetical protein